MPFPHVERVALVPRPALVVTPQTVGPAGLLIWTIMITNALRDAWPDDIIIPDAPGLGLLIPSKVRTAKIAAVEVASATRIGRLDAGTMLEVRTLVRRHLGL